MPAQFRILLVDDDPLLLDIVKRAASHSFPEASFIQVHNNAEARNYINELNAYGPKLVLLDIDLGLSKTGFDFLTFLQAHPQGRLLPVIILTVDELPTTIRNAYLVGVTSFTVKPDNLQGWKAYLESLRHYWLKTVTVPTIRFYKLDYWK